MPFILTLWLKYFSNLTLAVATHMSQVAGLFFSNFKVWNVFSGCNPAFIFWRKKKKKCKEKSATLSVNLIPLWKWMWHHNTGGGFKSQHCQQLLTGHPLKYCYQGPHLKKKNKKKEKERKLLKQVGRIRVLPAARQSNELSFFFFFFCAVHFWNHWNLLWVYQNGNFTPLMKGPTISYW